MKQSRNNPAHHRRSWTDSSTQPRTPEFGAIEEATESETTVTYLFEHGVAGRVCCRTGAVTISTDPVSV